MKVKSYLVVDEDLKEVVLVDKFDNTITFTKSRSKITVEIKYDMDLEFVKEAIEIIESDKLEITW